MKKLFTLLLLPFMLQAWDYHPCGEAPEKGQIVLVIPPGYFKCFNSDATYSFKLVRYSTDNDAFISRGFFTLTDGELLDLFKGEIPFTFTP